MRKVTRTLLATTAVAGLLALPVTGAVGADKEVTFTVAENESAISLDYVADAPASVELTTGGGGDPLFDLSSQGVTGTLPETIITDARGMTGQANGWTVTVSTVPDTSGVPTDWVMDGDPTKTISAAQGRVYMNATDVDTLTSSLVGLLEGMTISGGEFNTGTLTDNNLKTPYTLLSGYSSSLMTLGAPAEIRYTPNVSVEIPGSAAPGTYRAVVRQALS